MNFTKGEVIAINKPLGMTSFGALAFVRNRICKRLGVKRIKIGHAGTLDPLATGVLVLCTGRFTKRIEEFQLHGKEYVATLQFGATTPSYDMEHPVNETFPTDAITRESLEQVLTQFVGDIEQIPPTFSACKVNGQRAYDLRRNGADVELKPKHIRIDSIELMDFSSETMQATIVWRAEREPTSELSHATSDVLSSQGLTLRSSAAPSRATVTSRTACHSTPSRNGSHSRPSRLTTMRSSHRRHPKFNHPHPEQIQHLLYSRHEVITVQV